MTIQRLICVVDDDESVRQSLDGLLCLVGYRVETFSSGEAFLASDAPQRARCVLLDLQMPGMSGPEVQLELSARGCGVPVIIITARGNDDLASTCSRAGAVATFTKPFDEERLLAAIQSACS